MYEIIRQHSADKNGRLVGTATTKAQALKVMRDEFAHEIATIKPFAIVKEDNGIMGMFGKFVPYNIMYWIVKVS